MDWYSLFKFLRVSAAVIWIGAGFGTVALGATSRPLTIR